MKGQASVIFKLILGPFTTTASLARAWEDTAACVFLPAKGLLTERSLVVKAMLKDLLRERRVAANCCSKGQTALGAMRRSPDLFLTVSCLCAASSSSLLLSLSTSYPCFHFVDHSLSRCTRFASIASMNERRRPAFQTVMQAAFFCRRNGRSFEPGSTDKWQLCQQLFQGRAFGQLSLLSGPLKKAAAKTAAAGNGGAAAAAKPKAQRSQRTKGLRDDARGRPCNPRTAACQRYGVVSSI